MKRLTLAGLPLGLIGSAAILSGCGAPQNTANNSEPGRTASNSTGTDSTQGASNGGQKARIAVIPKGLAHVFWKSVRRGAEDAGKQFNAEIIWNGPSSEAEVSRQVAIVEDAVTQKVDAILVAPIDRKALVGAIDKAAAAKIPLALFDSDADTKKRLSFVATDNYKGGALAAARAAQITGGKGKVGVVPVQPNSQSTGDRERGFEETLTKKFPAMKVVKSNYGYSDRAKSLAAADDMLTAHPDLVAVFGPNESSAVGALQAMRNRNLKQVKLVGFDSAPVLVEALKSGDIDALIVQSPYKMGYEGVKALVDHRAGRRVAPRIDTGVAVITKANMNTPENQKLLQ